MVEVEVEIEGEVVCHMTLEELKEV